MIQGKVQKSNPISVDEGKVEDQVENEPSGAGGQIDDGSDELSTAIPDYSKKLEKKRRKKGKRTETEDEIEEGSSTPKAPTPPIRIGGYDANIRTDDIKASLKDAPNAKYYYPPKVMLGTCRDVYARYVCCNLQLNNLIEDTFETVKNVQGYSACNIARMANIIQ
ncbi:hypothetical protein OSTOST_11504, partial [Ostertagia ostertagi]